MNSPTRMYPAHFFVVAFLTMVCAAQADPISFSITFSGTTGTMVNALVGQYDYATIQASISSVTATQSNGSTVTIPLAGACNGYACLSYPVGILGETESTNEYWWFDYSSTPLTLIGSKGGAPRTLFSAVIDTPYPDLVLYSPQGVNFGTYSTGTFSAPYYDTGQISTDLAIALGLGTWIGGPEQTVAGGGLSASLTNLQQSGGTYQFSGIIDSLTLTANGPAFPPAPEPATVVLVAAALAYMCLVRRTNGSGRVGSQP